jgi:hypothetical protein
LSTQVAPVVVFLRAEAISAPATPVVQTVEVRAPEPAPRANVVTAAPAIKRPRPPLPALALLNSPEQAELPESAAHPFAGTTLETPQTAPLDSRVIAPNANALLVAAPLPSSQPASMASTPTPASPWEAVSNSATSAADGITRAAEGTGARARSAGVSIGRFFTRAGKAGASVF